MKRLAFLVSGGGTDMQSVFDAIDEGAIDARTVLVISSNARAYALTRAAKRGIEVAVLDRGDFGGSAEARDCEIKRRLDACKADLVILAGYLGILSECVTEAYAKRIINIHPALLPKFGGRGFYGINVHRAVLAAGETESGATVHYVDGGTDTGEIIRQVRVQVRPGDTPESLAERVLEAEHRLLPEVVAELCRK